MDFLRVIQEAEPLLSITYKVIVGGAALGILVLASYAAYSFRNEIRHGAARMFQAKVMSRL